MPATINEILVPVGDLVFFRATTATVLKAQLDNLNVPYDNTRDRKYELYYRLLASGNLLPNMPAGYIPTLPPLPPPSNAGVIFGARVAAPVVVPFPVPLPPAPGAPMVAPVAAPVAALVAAPAGAAPAGPAPPPLPVAPLQGMPPPPVPFIAPVVAIGAPVARWGRLPDDDPIVVRHRMAVNGYRLGRRLFGRREGLAHHYNLRPRALAVNANNLAMAIMAAVAAAPPPPPPPINPNIGALAAAIAAAAGVPLPQPPAPQLVVTQAQVVADIGPVAGPPPPPIEIIDDEEEAQAVNDQAESKDMVLFEMQAEEEIAIRNLPGNSTLQFNLMVWVQAEPDFKSVMGYHLYISLREPPPPGLAADAPNPNAFTDIGHIVAWGFSRPTARNPGVTRDTFQSEWLQGSAGDTEFKYKNGTSCITKALRAIYTNAGNVRPRIMAPFRAQLANDGTGQGLVYIQRLFVRDESRDRVPIPDLAVGANLDDPANTVARVTYANNGIAVRALETLYRLLQSGKCPIYCGDLTGPITYFLEPGVLNDPKFRAQWTKTRKADENEDEFTDRVQGVLEAWYLNPVRGFTRYDTPSATGGGGFMIAGRLVVAGQFPSLPTDAVLSTWNAALIEPVVHRSPRVGLIGSQASPSRSSNVAPPQETVSEDDADTSPIPAARARRARAARTAATAGGRRRSSVPAGVGRNRARTPDQ